MHPSSIVAISLTLATAIAAIGIAARANAQQQPAWLEIGISFNSVHQSIDAIRYRSPLDCAAALAGMKAEAARRRTSSEARIIFEPRCTTKPSWWIDAR